MRKVVALLVFGLLAACQLPLDPEGTTDRVQGAELVVGLLTARLGETDRAAVAAVAQEFDASPRLMNAAPDVLMAELESGSVHLLIGDVPSNTALATHAAATRDFGSVRIGEDSHKRIALVRTGENGFLKRVNIALGTPAIRTRAATAGQQTLDRTDRQDAAQPAGGAADAR
ncbi:hypothetical protein BV394_05940 [Brevirhabdus pacifica]|uniref:Uncharacterized protein n=1 Tax=Brevirhabdus pacifica TaxID=1267768 RepID=A0A1U7DH36_9RHOB|nr:hypothetical protein [Brevirhabdus pacifica]APX89314.1 hypothetical protein BV394_05940 [Brevirhabdus pacifica]PJJ86066.1 hypothetical protein CLV77_0599 [Brevirhabdus pacifica]